MSDEMCEVCEGAEKGTRKVQYVKEILLKTRCEGRTCDGCCSDSPFWVCDDCYMTRPPWLKDVA